MSGHSNPVLIFVFIVNVSAPLLSAQTTSALPSPVTFSRVDAPLAQRLVLDEKANHPEIKKIGLHAVPPGGSESVIIANAISSKIGKMSSANDLTVVTSGTPKVYPHEAEGGFFDLGLPMFDAHHQPIGMMVLEIPYKDAATREIALGMGSKIRDEVAARIPDKQALFR